MAEVEKVLAAAPTAASAADIPTSITGAGSSEIGSVAAEFGTSPNQERSSNSHPHDSEYDTASDLEGGEEYDDDDDLDDLDDDDDEDEDGESLTDDDLEDEDEEDRSGPSGNKEKIDAEAQKKVDEDRSNPQYIPKRGTFYEHDDRTADIEPNGAAAAGDGDSQDVGGAKQAHSPNISAASKTMKKWQQASGGDRWSHDRFDASEQAPKSRAELVNSYGYDIRTEEAPPRARRRRRYGRGPSKYSRNWEDETAYLKASNKERKPPRASDFPALNERQSKTRRSTLHGPVDEKENRTMEKRLSGGSRGSVRDNASVEKGLQRAGGAYADEPRRDRDRDHDRERDRPTEARGGRTKNYGRQNAPVGRQAAMEFKQKQRSVQNHQGRSSPPPNNRSADQPFERGQARSHNAHSHNNSNMGEQQLQTPVKTPGKSAGPALNARNAQMQNNDTYNNSMSGGKQGQEHGYQQSQSPQQKPQPQPQQQQQQHQQAQVQSTAMRPAMPPKTTPTSNLSQRLQQVQNRNDPSHVGSVQMHALATQNQLMGQQHQQQQQQQQVATMMLSSQQQQQQQHQAPTLQQQIPLEQRGPSKRYSSLRRSQHEAQQHLTDQQQQQQHQLQQMHLQQQPPQPLLLPDQRMLQANLIQLYHQENLAQMQALQVGGPTSAPPAKPTAYPSAQPPPQPYGAGAAPTPAAYYVAAPPDAYAPAAGAGAPPPPVPYVQQPPPNYLPPSQTAAAAAATLAYTSASPAPSAQQSAVPGGAPATYGAAANYTAVGGTTYFVPPAQATTHRPVVLTQRRPTNAIPILPPSEKNMQRPPAEPLKEDPPKDTGKSTNVPEVAPIGSAESIDHIIDNMFVQRPAFQPPVTATQARKSASPASTDTQSAANASDGVAAGAAVPPPVPPANAEVASNNNDAPKAAPAADVEQPNVGQAEPVEAAGSENNNSANVNISSSTAPQE